MAIYTIRPNTTFTIFKEGVLWVAGQEVDLTESEFEIHKHKLEGVDSTVEPLIFDSSGGYPAPHFNSFEIGKILVGESKQLILNGSFFSPNTTVELEQGTVTSVDFISDNQLKITVTAANIAGKYDLILNNGNQTVVENAIEFFDLPDGFVDLRLGGTEFTPAAIEMRSDMSFTRQADGLFFNGENPFSSSAKFVGDNNDWVWNKTENKKLSWIFTNSETIMLGVGNPEITPNSGTQYRQAEAVCYFSGDSLFGFYGNSGNIGSNRSQNFSSDVPKKRTDILRFDFIPNVGADWLFYAYILPSDNIADWFDTSNLLAYSSLEGFGSVTRDNLPFCIPRDGTGSKFLGFIIGD